MHTINKNTIHVKVDYKKIHPNVYVKGIKFFLTKDLTSFVKKVKKVIERESRIQQYNIKYKSYLKQKDREPVATPHKGPKISILMPLYKTPIKFLKLAIDSVVSQSYSNWELCIVDDSPNNLEIKKILDIYIQKHQNIRVFYSPENEHISRASNRCLKLATGQYTALFDHDDLLHPDALAVCVKLIQKTKCDFVYTDEDKIDENGHRTEPHFKPDWSPETLLSGNYITHFTIIRTTLLRKIGGFRQGYEGAQDFDLFLRISEVTSKIEHAPRVLYSWRMLKTSTASTNNNAKSSYAYKNGVKSLQDAFSRRGLKAKVDYGQGRGLYFYEISSKKIISVVYINEKNNLGSYVYEKIKNSAAKYLFFIDRNTKYTKKLLENTAGFFEIKSIAMVSCKVASRSGVIQKTGIIKTNHDHKEYYLDAFRGLSDGGYFNFNYTRMTKNYSYTSLFATAIDATFFKKQNLSQLKNLHTTKEIGIFLSNIATSRGKRIVYNPNYEAIGKINNSAEIMNFYPHEKIKKDPMYNLNLTKTETDFMIEV